MARLLQYFLIVTFTSEEMKSASSAGEEIICSFGTVLFIICCFIYRAENPHMNEVLTSWNRTGDYEYLQSYFVERVLDIVSRLGNKAAIGIDSYL